LGIELIDLSSWTCCGGAFPLASDNKMGLVAPTRILATAAKEDPNAEATATDAEDTKKPEVYLTTLCAFCYNVLKRTNNLLTEDDYKLRKLNEFMDENYQVNVRVKHFLEILRDDFGFENITSKIKQPLNDLNVVPYYGCQLLRPSKELQLDDPEQPNILEDFLTSIGSTVVDFPFKNECCGSYQIMDNKEIALELTYKILNNAVQNGAEALALSCPVCYYNLDKKQKELSEQYSGFQNIPVFYFSELLAIALKLDLELLEFNRHYVDPRPILKEKKLI
jgi:heterodisulfide reductase subunit B